MPAKPTVTSVPIDTVKISGDNMRLDVGELDELAESIVEVGILQPLVLTRTGKNLLVVCGHRRLAAARRAGLTEVPAIIREFNEEQRLVAMTIENIHRKPLTPIETAKAYERLHKKGFTQTDIGRRIGKTGAHVSQLLSLLKLPKAMQDRIHKGEVTYTSVLKKGSAGGKGPDARKAADKWQIHWLDKIIRWLESGNVVDALMDDQVFNRLKHLLEVAKSLTDRVRLEKRPPHDEDLDDEDPNVVKGIKMCDRCGTVVGYIAKCCADHDQKLCEKCTAATHDEEGQVA